MLSRSRDCHASLGLTSIAILVNRSTKNKNQVINLAEIFYGEVCSIDRKHKTGIPAKGRFQYLPETHS